MKNLRIAGVWSEVCTRNLPNAKKKSRSKQEINGEK
jgi:hypothetical protein